MNDFTKEELIEIAEYCNWEPHDTGHSDFRRNLRMKLQSMIDNYSEIKPPTMANYCCPKCIEEWHQCECKND
jgi:hypothetical protein